MGRLLRPALLASGALMLAGALTLVAAVTMGGATTGTRPSEDRAVGSGIAQGIDPLAVEDTQRLVATLQARLEALPDDHRSWSALAVAYIEAARTTADPSFYPKAERALDRAARLAPGDPVMLTARATLQNARHDFTAALASADAAVAANPYSAAAHAVRADALTELGRYAAAQRAADRADVLEPGTATFARLSYQAELRGDLRAATRLMTLARDAAGRSATAFAYAAVHLGDLARARGDLGGAGRHYRAALDADPGHLPAVAGLARLAVARGDLAEAERGYRRVVRALPLTEYVVELGELYQATGRPALAARQYAVAAATARLLEANGVAADLETALFQADHGDPAAALAAARAEWSSRHSIHAADALAWALHANGQDRAALRHARAANRLGTQDARLLFHLGAIEAALGRAAAAEHLRAARRLDAGTSPWLAAAIDELLTDLP